MFFFQRSALYVFKIF